MIAFKTLTDWKSKTNDVSEKRQLNKESWLESVKQFCIFTVAEVIYLIYIILTYVFVPFIELEFFIVFCFSSAVFFSIGEYV